MRKTYYLLLLLILVLFIHIFCDEKDLLINNQFLTNKIKSDSGQLTRKELLLLINQPKLSVMLDLGAGLKNEYYQTVAMKNETIPLFRYLDLILDKTDLFYHTDNNALFIGSEWSWLTKEEIYQKEYDITGLYNLKEELRTLIENTLAPFDVVKCKYEINFLNSKQCAITTNKYIHYYLKQFFENLKKPISDFSDNSPQLIFPAEIAFKNKPLNTLPCTLSAEEWLILIGQLNSENVIFNNDLINIKLKSTQIKVEKDKEPTDLIFKQIITQTNEKIYYQKNRGIFFNQNTMLKMVPIQGVQFRVYNIKQFTNKLNGAFVCQNIKDEIKKDMWIYPENQVIYYKHLEAIIVIAPPHCFPDIDNFFLNLKQSAK